MTKSKSKSKRPLKFHAQSWNSNEFFEYQRKLEEETRNKSKLKVQKFLLKHPKIKLWVNHPTKSDASILWIVDLKKGIAEKVNETNSSSDTTYPERRTHFKTIEEFLSAVFDDFCLRLDLTEKEKGKIKFNPPLIDANVEV
jgi:hypothetical protein